MYPESEILTAFLSDSCRLGELWFNIFDITALFVFASTSSASKFLANANIAWTQHLAHSVSGPYGVGNGCRFSSYFLLLW